MSRHIAHAGLLVEILQVGLHTGYIADYTLLRQVWYHLLKHGYGIFQRHCVYQQFGLKLLYLLVGGKALTVVCKPHAFGVFFKHRHLIVKTQQVDEE